MSFQQPQPDPNSPYGAPIPGVPLGQPLPSGGAPQQQYIPPQGYVPPGYPPGSSFPTAPQAYYPPPLQGFQELPWYLGTRVPDPFAPPVQYGVQKVAGYDPNADSDAIRKATKGFGTNDSLLISTLVPLSVLQRDAVAHNYMTRFGKVLVDVLDSESSSWFKMGLHGIATGPLAWDVELIHQALAGIGTNEILLTEILLGRTPADLHLLSAAYHHKYGRQLIDKVRADLSGKIERMFLMALNANPPPDSVPVNPVDVEMDVDNLYKAAQGKAGTNEIAFCEIIINRSRTHLSAIIAAYAKKYRSLTKVIKSEFSGTMRAGLLHIVEGAKPKRDMQGIWRDAKLIDKAMVGMGTRDIQLVWRIVRAQWDPARMVAIRDAYKRRTNKDLEARVASETSGSYKKLMVALVTGQVKK